jgi:CelD/BcsL family acetyltransferase involved in cellulose biosynthesis
MTIERNSWKADWISREENRGFLIELLRRCNDNEWLDFYFLQLNDTPIAYLFTIRYLEKAYALFTSYSIEYAPQSPGFVCLYFMINQLFEDRQKVKELDLITDYEYVRRWTSLERSRFLTTMYEGSLSGQAVRLGRWIIHRKRS